MMNINIILIKKKSKESIKKIYTYNSEFYSNSQKKKKQVMFQQCRFKYEIMYFSQVLNLVENSVIWNV